MDSIFSLAWDSSLIVFIQRFMNGTLVKLSGFITEFGDATILVAVVGLFYWALNKKIGKKLVVYLSLINIVNPCLKCLIRRKRPYMLDPEMLNEIADNNKKELCAEITVVMEDDTARLIIRDPGEVNSIIKKDDMPDFIRKYCIDTMIRAASYRDYLITNGKNRYIFEFADARK